MKNRVFLMVLLTILCVSLLGVMNEVVQVETSPQMWWYDYETGSVCWRADLADGQFLVDFDGDHSTVATTGKLSWERDYGDVTMLCVVKITEGWCRGFAFKIGELKVDGPTAHIHETFCGDITEWFYFWVPKTTPPTDWVVCLQKSDGGNPIQVTNPFWYSEDGGATWKEFDPSTVSEPLHVEIIETVNMSGDGSCHVNFTISMSASPLASLYRKALGFLGNIPNSNPIDIPRNIPVPWSINTDATTLPGGYANVGNTSIADASYEDTPSDTTITKDHLYVKNETGGSITQPVREQFLNAVRQEQLCSLGINIPSNSHFTRYVMWGEGGACWVHLEADGLLQVVSSDTIAIGPKNLNASYDSASFILSKIGFIQQMVRRIGGGSYNSSWTTNIILPSGNSLENWEELNAKEPWHVDFGNNTNMRASVVASPNQVVLEETIGVTGKNITKTEKDLLKQGFLCYKVFNMELANPISTCYGIKGAGGISDDWSWGWRIHLWDGQFTLQFDAITLDVETNLNLRGFIGWKHKWFRLEWCKAWMELEVSLNVDIKIEYEQGVSYSYSNWSKTLFEWNATYYFWVGPFPVRAKLEFTPIATIAIDVKAETDITCGVYATGRLRAGAGWKRHGGWGLIYDAGMEVNRTDPTFTDTNMSVTVTVTPSVCFHLSLLFYELAGPFVEFEPYVTLSAWYSTGSGWGWGLEVGLNVNAGVEFVDLLKKVLRLSDYKRTLWNRVLWSYPEVGEHNVTITDVRAPKRAFAGEDISICVDVLNRGTYPDPEDVTVTLTYWDSQSKVISMKRKNWTTFNFTCSTEDKTSGNYSITAKAMISGTEYDQRTIWVYLDTQDVAITSVNANPLLVAAGQKVTIDVTVKNEGTADVSALPVFAYYDDPPQPISDVWCEYMHMVFDLKTGVPEDLSFTWDTTGVYPEEYTISAKVALLPYETNTTDNTHIDGTVTIVNSPPVLDLIGDKIVDELTTLSFTTTATDPDVPPQILTFSLGPGAPPGASITSGGVFSWTPTEAQGPGVYNINITVSDGIDIDYEVIEVTVYEVNLPSVLNPIGDKTVSEGALLKFTVTASDPDIPAQTLTYSANNLPSGATFDPNTRVFSWTPTSGQAGVYPAVHFEVSDDYLKDSEDITITVTAPSPPVGGVWVPVDKLGLLVPYIGLVSTIIVATVATAIYAKRVKRRKEKQ